MGQHWICGRGTFVAFDEKWRPHDMNEIVVYRAKKTFNPFLRGLLIGIPICALLLFIIIEIWRLHR